MESQEHLTEEQIALFAEAINSGTAYTLPTPWRAHVDSCAQCAFEVTAVSELVDAEQDTAQSPVKTSSSNWFLSHKRLAWFGIAASIMLIAVLGYFFMQERVNKQGGILADSKEQPTTDSRPNPDSNNKDKASLVNVADTSKTGENTQIVVGVEESDLTRNESEPTQSAGQNQLAYLPQKHLEALTQRFTNGNMRSEQGAFSYPAIIRADSGESISIQLDSAQNEAVILEFLDNTGQKLFEVNTSEHRYQVQKLQSPGLYYYKVISQEFDLLFCGKIIIVKE